ncbi:hypothetical protein H8S95_07095 [Pontibacter sp. KCTC 32443]|uniref:hypothetical protein n=1 Tax=Pontibacter TaxID=323449 RepID=UPI00164E852B|nr:MULTISPECIES: hypothetical protein [Pontibacter]MBC5773823.1 hypothetical protein [Pontibacter sp. KCTC 32443]
MLLRITRIFVFFLLLQLPLAGHAQEFTQNIKALLSLYVEVGGNSDSYAINFDHILYQQEQWKGGLRAGLGTNMFFMEEEPGVYPVVPIEAYALLGKSRNNMEFGVGYTRRFTDAPELLQNMYFGRIGFRYQVPAGGLLVRFGLTPFISPENKDDKTGHLAVVPRFGLSIGRSW